MMENIAESMWTKFTNIVLDSGTMLYSESLRVNSNRPGWNTFVRIEYDESRRALLTWRCAGLSRNGILADDMRRKKAVFKLSIIPCKREENLMRVEAIA